MKVIDELLPGCFLLQAERYKDQRGYFVKTYHEGLYSALRVNFKIREEFVSISRKNVLRDVYFQLPPHAHEKLVYCTRGRIHCVLSDLRGGEAYGRVATADESDGLIFLSKGIADDFVTLKNELQMLYKTSTVHVRDFDCGIHWDSFGFNWRVCYPIISARDTQHHAFDDFASSPF